MTVYLVGAGPGDPGLLTVRAAEVLGRADVVVHDRVAGAGLLELAPAAARRVDVGKASGGPVDQDEINDLLVSEGAAGRTVVRLKGGDPFVFGSGGEEAEALLAAGVPFEVVPGVTSAVAAPAYAGVPVTHRGRPTSFTVVTGHSRHASDRATDWSALAKVGGTIVVLMGVAHRAEMAEQLIEGGLNRDTPVLAVTWATQPEQRSVRVSLGDLGSTPLEPPATIVIGAVAALDLSWYERRALFGRRVIVPRSRSQAPALSRRLRDLGATPIEIPTISFEPPGDGGAGLQRAARGLRDGAYHWVAFTSANAVAPLLDRVADWRWLAAVRVAAIGPGTAGELARHRLPADLVPERNIAEGLLHAFPDPSGPGAAVLVARAAEGRDVLPDGLTAAGWNVDLVEAYRTVRVPVTEEMARAARSADAACFTSSSTVIGLVEALGVGAVPPVVVCIGPATAATAAAAGLAVAAVADPNTLDGLVDALAVVLARSRRG
ncbi:MAG: uroporphyrinogen-III C-methyltransferase [Acidimicrobiales bacterium]